VTSVETQTQQYAAGKWLAAFGGCHETAAQEA
jgi:hypothetical protein